MKPAYIRVHQGLYEVPIRQLGSLRLHDMSGSSNVEEGTRALDVAVGSAAGWAAQFASASFGDPLLACALCLLLRPNVPSTTQVAGLACIFLEIVCMPYQAL